MNNTSLGESSREFRTQYEIAISTIVLTIIMLVAITGNVLVIIAIYKHKSLRENMSSMFLVNLSLTDLTMATVVMATSVVSISMDWTSINYVWCAIWGSINYCLQTVTMLTMCFIAVERYIAVKYLLRHCIWVTRKRVLIILGYTWVQGIVFPIAATIKDWFHYDYWETVCAVDWDGKQAEMFPEFVTITFVICVILPSLVMFFCYARIIQIIKSMPRNIQPQSANNQARNKKLIFSLITVVVVFIASYSPYATSKFLMTASIHIPGYIDQAASFLVYAVSAVNPFIYGIFRPEFKRAYKKILKEFKMVKLGSWICPK